MPTDVDQAFSELTRYLEQYALQNGVRGEPLQSVLKSAYRRYHATLIWHSYFGRSRRWGAGAKMRAQYVERYTEAISDLAQSVLIGVQGMYKPSFLILRSGVENYFKCILVAHGKKIDQIDNVFKLIDLVKKTAVAKTSEAGKAHVQRLCSEYSALCKYVHTSDKMHMAQTNFLGVFPRWDGVVAPKFYSSLAAVSIGIAALNCLIFREQFKKMHHTNYDQICDVLPKTTKIELSS